MKECPLCETEISARAHYCREHARVLDAVRRRHRSAELAYARTADAQEARREAIAEARAEGFTLQALADVMGVSRGRVNQLGDYDRTRVTKRAAKREARARRRKEDQLAA